MTLHHQSEETMSCYLPLVQRWRKPRKEKKIVETNLFPAAKVGPVRSPTSDDISHVRATRDQTGVTLSQGMGDFPHQVFLNIRHDHPTLGLDDVAYQRLHQEHTHRSRRDAGVVSLGLPLGISSLKLSSKPRKVKNRRSKGHASDGDLEPVHRSRELEPRVISPRTPSIGPGAQNARAQRRSSLPRKSKIPSEVEYLRPLSVDADLLLQSARRTNFGDQSSHGGSRLGETRGSVSGSRFSVHDPRGSSWNLGEVEEQSFVAGSRLNVHEDRDQSSRFAHLTSTQHFMSGQQAEKSSSGNSSGSDVTWEGSPSPLHPALRGRGQPELAVATRGPPPKHLLPKKLRPSPLTKLHPMVVLTPELRKGKDCFMLRDDTNKKVFFLVVGPLRLQGG